MMKMNVVLLSTAILTLFVSLVLAKGGSGGGGGGGNSACSNVKPADVRLNLLNGTWYVQSYTGPTLGGKLQTQCDTFNITVSPGAANATINYTFINTISNEMGFEIANVTYKSPGFYLYQVTVQGQTIAMNTYILLLNTQYYVHMACSANNLNADATFLIASRNRDVTSDSMRQLENEAAELGADTRNVMSVNQVNCNGTDFEYN